nr:Ig-like domain-containing protein [Agarivorans sp. B2Z047]
MDGRVAPYVSPAYLTCVTGVGILRLNIYTVDGSTVVADGVARTRVRIQVSDIAGRVVPGVVINIEQEGEADAPSSVVSNENGQATFELRSTVANDVKITASLAEGESDPESVSVVVEFIGDKSTAELAGLEIIEDEASADGVMVNTFEVEVVDAYGNPVEGVDVDMHYSGSGNGPYSVASGAAGKGRGDVTLYSSEEFRGGGVDITASLGSTDLEATTTFFCRFLDGRGEGCAGDFAVFIWVETLPPLHYKEADRLGIEYQSSSAAGAVKVTMSNGYTHKYCEALNSVNYLGSRSWKVPDIEEARKLQWNYRYEQHKFNHRWIADEDSFYWTYDAYMPASNSYLLEGDNVGDWHLNDEDSHQFLSCIDGDMPKAK